LSLSLLLLKLLLSLLKLLLSRGVSSTVTCWGCGPKIYIY
jgi:hypothetical protein